MSDNLLLKKLCDAASRNDAATVGSLLGCRKMHSPSIDEPLLCSSELVDRLIQCSLRRTGANSDASSGDSSLLPDNDTTVEHAVKAWLVSPSVYETPWKIACAFIQYVHHSNVGNINGNRLILRSLVADIQSFLQHAVASWWEEERKQTAAVTSSGTRHRRRSIRPVEGEVLAERNPRYWILELVSVVMEPLLVPVSEGGASGACQGFAVPGDQTTANPNKNDHWTVPFDLISTIVSLSKDLEALLLRAVLDLIFGNKRSVRSDRILLWVNAASELRLFLRDEDWTTVHASLRRALIQRPCPVHRRDLPGLAEIILSLSTTTTTSNSNVTRSSWQELILQLLSVAASTDLATFSTVETIIESSLASLPSRALHLWATPAAATTSAEESLSAESFKKRWIEANLILLVFRASQQSGSQLVSRLVAQAFGGTKGCAVPATGNDDLTSACWKRLIRLTSATTESSTKAIDMHSTLRLAPSHGASKERRSASVLKLLRRIFDGATYAGRGRFENQTGEDHATTTLTGMSSLAFHSLVLDWEDSLQTPQLLHATERAQAWVRCANDALQSKCAEAIDLVFAIVILITIYCEIPMARSSLARNMLQAFSSTEADFGVDIDCMATVHSLVISVVLTTSRFDGSPSHGVFSDLDIVADVFAQPIPSTVFYDLARALSPLSSARQALLATAQTQLGSALSVHSWSAMDVSGRGINDSFERVKCGLFALVVLISVSVWEDCEIAAWSLLSDVIVENRPHLPFQARLWLFQQLKVVSANKQHLKENAAKHLQRACLARLLRYVGPDNNGRESFSYEKAFATWGNGLTKQIEDISGLFDLVFTLLHRDTVEDGIAREEQRVAFARCRELLPGLIELERHGTSLAAPAVEDFGGIHPTLPLLDFDSSFLCYVAFYCLALALQDATTGRLSFDGKMLPSLSNISLFLVKQEQEELGVSPESQSLPTWLTPKKHVVGILACRKQRLDKRKSMPIRLALYDAVVELLLGPAQLFSSRVNEMDGRPSNSSRLWSMQLTAILSRKRELTDALRGESENNAIVPCSQDKLAVEFEGFCAFVVPVLKYHISDQGDLSETDEMLSTSIDLCERVTIVSKEPRFESDGFSMHRRLMCFWDLYTVLCEEKAAVRLIGYLESQRCEGGKKQICRMSLDGPDDIDCVVRRVRISVVRSVSVAFDDYLQRKGSELLEYEKKEWGPEGSDDAPLEYFVRFINCVTADLLAGLEGASGGLTYDLFLFMIDCITQCAKILLVALPSSRSIDSAVLASLISVCQSASIDIEGIFCNFALRQAAAFKKTMMLCVGTLPALARCARRHISPLASTHQSRTFSIATKLFDQLTCVLKRKTEFDSAPGTPWELVVGKDHLGGKNDLNYDDDDVSVLSDGFVDWVDRRESPPQNVDILGSSKEMILLQTERSWTWSLCCVLQAFEDDWEGSLQLVRDSHDAVGSKVELGAYYDIRQYELADTLRSICMLFQSTKRQANPDAGNEVDMSVYAVAVPSAVKIKLCLTVDRVLVALQKSIKRVVSQFQSQANSLATDISCRSFAEAITCLSAWLTLRTEGAELSSGVQRWYMAEKQFARLPRHENGTYAAESPALRRLPKLIFRLEDVDLALRKLLQMIQRYGSLPKKSGRSLLLNEIDNLIEQSDTEQSGSTFSKLLSDKLTFLEREQHQLECDAGLSAADDQASGKKRRSTIDIVRRVHRERRRRVVRSRNGVVDMFLHMDRRTGEDEAMHDDAYADLEDFLVDG